MNYRHAFHAGNFADVLKHVVLIMLIEHLKKKPAPFFYLDTHAGRGLYDLSDAQAQRSGEYKGGIGRLLDERAAIAPGGNRRLRESRARIRRPGTQRDHRLPRLAGHRRGAAPVRATDSC